MAAELFVIATVHRDPAGSTSAASLQPWVEARFPDAAVAAVPGAAAAVTGDPADTASLVCDEAGIRAVAAVSAQALSRASGHRGAPSLGMDGGHVAVNVRPDRGTVEVRNDGLGALPFYWTVHRDTFFGATQLGALVGLGVPPAWDEPAVAQYLALLHPLGERTLLRGVSCLPAGSRLTVGPSGTTVSSAPLFAPRDGESASDDVALSRFQSAWREALTGLLDRAATQRLGVALSGGLDSRAVVSGLVGIGSRPLTFTYGGPAQREVRVARLIAERLRLPHLELPVGDAEMLAGLVASAALLDGGHSPAEFYDHWFVRRLRQSLDVVVSGLWGGPLWGGDKSFGLSTPAAAADAYLHRVGGSLSSAAKFLTGWSVPDVEQAVRTDALAGLSRWAPRTDLSVFWNVDNRQRRWGLAVPVAMARAGLPVEAPFLEGPVVAALAALTPEQRRYGRLHLIAHQRLFSDLADIPRGNDGNAPDALDHVYWSGDRTIGSQLWDLARSHPVSAARRLRTQGTGRLVARLPRGGMRTRAADRVATRGEVFPAAAMARAHPVYRARLADYLEQAVATLPTLLSASALQSAADELRRSPALTFDPLVAARAATLGTWARLWSEPQPSTV